MKQKIYLFPVAAAILTAFSLASCSKAKVADIQTYSEAQARLMKAQADELRAAGKVAAAEAKQKEAADHYARIGELLLMPEGVGYADEMFQRSLELDPNNGKANFYKSETEIILLFQGFVPRIERLLMSEEGAEGLERVREEIKKLKMPEVSQFAHNLPAGQRTFSTFYDIQRFVRESLYPAILSSVEKLNRIDSTKPLKLNFTPARAEIDPERRSNDYSYHHSTCTYTPAEGYQCETRSYHYFWEEKKLANEYFLDRHDLKLIKSSFLALADQIKLATAYSIKDAEYVLRRLKAVDAIRGGLRAHDLVTVLRDSDQFLVLEKDQLLGELPKSLTQTLKNFLEFEDLRDELCHTSSRNEFNSGFRSICLSAEVVDALRLGLDLLAGPKEVTLGKDVSGNRIKILMDVTSILSNPPKDLKDLLPTFFNERGEPTQYPDATMSGLFPNGDFIEKMKRLYSQDQVMSSIRQGIRQMKDHL